MQLKRVNRHFHDNGIKISSMFRANLTVVDKGLLLIVIITGCCWHVTKESNNYCFKDVQHDKTLILFLIKTFRSVIYRFIHHSHSWDYN